MIIRANYLSEALNSIPATIIISKAPAGKITSGGLSKVLMLADAEWGEPGKLYENVDSLSSFYSLLGGYGAKGAGYGGYRAFMNKRWSQIDVMRPKQVSGTWGAGITGHAYKMVVHGVTNIAKFWFAPNGVKNAGPGKAGNEATLEVKKETGHDYPTYTITFRNMKEIYPNVLWENLESTINGVSDLAWVETELNANHDPDDMTPAEKFGFGLDAGYAVTDFCQESTKQGLWKFKGRKNDKYGATIFGDFADSPSWAQGATIAALNAAMLDFGIKQDRFGMIMQPAKGATKAQMVAAMISAVQSEVGVMPYPHIYTSEASVEKSNQVLTGPQSWMAAALSYVPSEIDPGILPVSKDVLYGITGFENDLDGGEMQELSDVGVTCFYQDEDNRVPTILQGLTTSADRTREAYIYRRRMADEIESAETKRLTQYRNAPIWQLKDEAAPAVESYLKELKGTEGKGRIKDYKLDYSLNTQATEDAGNFIIMQTIDLHSPAYRIILISTVGAGAIKFVYGETANQQ